MALNWDFWQLHQPTGDDDFPTDSSELQHQVESTVRKRFVLYSNPAFPRQSHSSRLKLQRGIHVSYLLDALRKPLPSYFVSLDASKPWLIYWMLHSLDLLGMPIEDEIKERAVCELRRCWTSTGGFAGGHGQIAHVAATYAAVNALAIVGTQEAMQVVDRDALLSWWLSLKQPDGSFIMHRGGEVDVRGTYCIMAAAKLLGIMAPDLMHGAGEFVARCQTYEGGISGLPGREAHGGYTFCALAAALLLGTTHLLDLDALTDWVVFRQCQMEGGFQGRINKLVDGCYSFWCAGLVPLLKVAREETAALITPRTDEKAGLTDQLEETDLLNREALQHYILLACQSRRGGLRDKPDKSPDFYHTCYVLSGLSISQHHYSWDPFEREINIREYEEAVLVGGHENLLLPTHPLHNVLPSHVARMQRYFSNTASTAPNSTASVTEAAS